jgi:hypothetical protein
MDNFEKMSMLSQAMVADEIKYDPTAIRYIEPLINSKYPTTAIHEDAIRAMVHAIRPYMYPEYANKWPVFQARAKAHAPAYGLSGLGTAEEDAINAEMAKLGIGGKTPTAPTKPDEKSTNDWAACVSSVLGSVASAWGGIAVEKQKTVQLKAALKADVQKAQIQPVVQQTPQIDPNLYNQQNVANDMVKDDTAKLEAEKKKKLYWTIGLTGGGLVIGGIALWLILKKKKTT